MRQALSVYSGEPGLAVPFLAPHYDVLARVLTYRTVGQLTANALYRIEMLLPSEPGSPGLRAFDGVGLTERSEHTRVSFMSAGSAGYREPFPLPQQEPTCGEVLALFQGSCASSCCHAGRAPAMGLALDSAAGLRQTAIGQVAHQTAAPELESVPFENARRFGTAMAIIDPGSPATSYLVYKMLLRPENLSLREPGAFQTAPCQALENEESQRIADWFVRGRPMPPPGVHSAAHSSCELPARDAVSCEEFRRINRFIELGARCDG